MKNLCLEEKFITSINFFDSILFLDSFDNSKKVYNMLVDYIKKDNHYLLKLNIRNNNEEIISTECTLANKINGSIVIKDLINLVTSKYNNDLIIDVKEFNINNNCVKFGRRKYNSKN